MKTLSKTLSPEMIDDLLSGGKIVWYVNGKLPSVLIKLSEPDSKGYMYHHYDALDNTDTYYLAVRRNGNVRSVIKDSIADNIENRRYKTELTN